MVVDACDYRVELKRPGTFYCRHPQVFSALNLVSAQVCHGCSQRLKPCSPRSVPSHLDDIDGEWKFYRTSDLVTQAHHLASQLPSEVDAIVGIARSGLLPATAIATQLHLPLYSISNQRGVRDLGTGGRGTGISTAEHPHTIAIVDDSVFGGIAMEAAVKLAKERLPFSEIIRAAIYVRPEGARAVDLIGRLAPAPHFFEWNLFNCLQAQYAALDFDGVLCQEWEGDEEQDPVRYQNHVESARPLHLPRRGIVPLVVSARLEQHRSACERWLARWQVSVKRLVLGSWNTAAERRAQYSAGEFKGQAYKRSKCTLFVESCERQSREIFEVARKPVLALSTGKVFH